MVGRLRRSYSMVFISFVLLFYEFHRYIMIMIVAGKPIVWHWLACTHTHTHIMLQSVDYRTIQMEIGNSKNDFEPDLNWEKSLVIFPSFIWFWFTMARLADECFTTLEMEPEMLRSFYFFFFFFIFPFFFERAIVPIESHI